MHVQTFTDNKSFIHKSAQIMREACTQEKACIGLSGGKTPIPIYRELTPQDVASAQLYMLDERYVPASDPRSNVHAISMALPPVPIENFDTSLPIEQSLAAYSKKLPEMFTLCILGIGTDGHVTSLFPHSPALTEKNSVAHTTTDTLDVRDRLTVTFPLIISSKKILLVASGKSKKQIIDDLLHSQKTVDELPAKKLLGHPNITIHYLQYV